VNSQERSPNGEESNGSNGANKSDIAAATKPEPKKQRKSSFSDKHEFRPIAIEILETPVPLWERVTFWTVIALVIASVAWLTIGQVDVVVSARGKVIPEGQTLLIQPLETGVVRAIPVKSGDAVTKGQLLMEIEPELTEPEMLSADEELAALTLEQQRIQALLSEVAFAPHGKNYTTEQIALQRCIYLAEMEKLSQQIQTKAMEKAATRKELVAAHVAQNESSGLLSIAQQKWKKIEPVAHVIASRDVDSVKEELVR
jgi:hemolysin D